MLANASHPQESDLGRPCWLGNSIPSSVSPLDPSLIRTGEQVIFGGAVGQAGRDSGLVLNTEEDAEQSCQG